MLTGGELAGLILAVFWAVLVAFLALTLLKLARLLNEAGEFVSELSDQAGPLLEDMTRTVGRANEQLGRTDVITKQVAGVTQNVSAVSTVMTSVVGGPLVKAAAFSYGVRKALGSRDGEEPAHGGDGGRPAQGELQHRPARKAAGKSTGRTSGRGRR